MPKKETDDTKEETPEFAAVSIESLSEHFGGDAVRAERVMNEIGELGGFGRANAGSTFALISASDEIQKGARDLINKAKKEYEKEAEKK